MRAQSQLEVFRTHAANEQWREIHYDHYDWYMFPIEDGSKRRFNVFQDDVTELLADEEWKKEVLPNDEVTLPEGVFVNLDGKICIF